MLEHSNAPNGLFNRCWPVLETYPLGMATTVSAAPPVESGCSRRGYAHRELVCDRLVEIDAIVELLRDAWRASPDQRLGQLVANVAKWADPFADPFYVDDVMLASDLFLWTVRHG